MTDDITRMLEGAVPADPDPRAWGPAARRRSNTRRAGGVGLALIVAVAAPLTYLALRGGDVAVPAQSPSPAPSTAPTATNPCAEIIKGMSEDGPTLTALGNERLPAGATRAWFCGDQQQAMTAGPAEPLTVGVEDLVKSFNALEPLAADAACTDEYRLTYELAFDYPDGRKVVAGTLHGCRAVTDGRTNWGGGDALFEAATSLWQKQREAVEAPAEVPATCPPIGTLLVARPADVQAGSVCVGHGDTFQAVPLPADLFDQVKASLQTDMHEETPDTGLTDSQFLVLTDGWGSTLTLVAFPERGFGLFNTAEIQGNYWQPPEALETQIRALMPAVPQQSQPVEGICAGGVEYATGDLTDAVRASACVRGPGDVMEEVQLPDDLAKTFVAASTGKWVTVENEFPGSTGATLNLFTESGAVYQLQWAGDGALVWFEDGKVSTFTPEGELAETLKGLLDG